MSQTQSNAASYQLGPLEAYAAYPFAADDIYQQGLASILAGVDTDNQSLPEREEVLRRTRVFYFNKISGNSITMDEAREYEHAHNTSDPPSNANTSPLLTTETSASSTDETRVLSFAELKELIETGRLDQIPNNKIIPEGLNDAPPSESSAPVRKKPWETRIAETESTQRM